ncbi:MAG: Do family serine endopeptidase [Beijerinckiaceae bacterium]|nr:Do family serine endopeptidase [Beijerinckiaceae bacterium]
MSHDLDHIAPATVRAPVRKALRNSLLGACAALAIGAMSVPAFLPQSQAQAQTQAQAQNDNRAQAQNRAEPRPVTIPATVPGAIPSFADIIDRVKPAVVSVRVRITEGGNAAMSGRGGRGGMPPGVEPGDPLERFFRRFGDEGQRQRPRESMAQGSGFIISADGYVVTNNHVVQNASDVTLGLDDGRTVRAKVIGTDEKTDLALLKIEEQGNYPFTDWEDGVPRIGDWVLAVGNPFGLGGTVTAGIISARGRDIGAGPYDDFLQIDAPVNRGNSGGPTFDLHGRVVGVNTAIYSPSGGSVGIGFAIPASVARDVIAQLRENGSVSRGYIGVQIQAITPEIADSLGLRGNNGALIAETQTNTPAAKAGLRSGDVIVSVDGARVDNPRELSRRIAALGPKRQTQIGYVRDGREQTVSVQLEALPERTADARGGANRNGQQQDADGQRLGLRLTPGSEGVEVAEVEPGSPAARNGLREGDVILDVAGKSVKRPADVANAVREARSSARKSILMRVRSAEGVRYVAIPTA